MVCGAWMRELWTKCVGFVDYFSLVARRLRKITRQFNVPSALCVGVLAMLAWLVCVRWLVCVSCLLDQSQLKIFDRGGL